MNNGKRCLIIYPNGERKYVNKIANSSGYHDLILYLSFLNSGIYKEMDNYPFHTYTETYILYLIWIDNRFLPVNHELKKILKDYTLAEKANGILGVVKCTRNGEQIDYEEGDIENAINYKNKL
jgi:hypothetical protein